MSYILRHFRLILDAVIIPTKTSVFPTMTKNSNFRTVFREPKAFLILLPHPSLPRPDRTSKWSPELLPMNQVPLMQL
jgi:hypothetical protein